MLARLIVWAVGAALLLSTAALAAGTTTNEPAKDQNRIQTAAVTATQRCTGLETQFDDAINTHASMAKASSARLLRTQGAALCSSGQHESGIIKLQQALKDIGVEPKM